MTMQDGKSVFTRAVLVRVGTDVAVLADDYRGPQQRLLDSLKSRLWLFVLVVAPTLLGFIYFGFIQSDRYVSEAKFVVRSPASGTVNALASALQGTGIVRSADDAYAVNEYLESRDALAKLVDTASLRDIFRRQETDFLSRFPLLGTKDNEENLFRYYLKHIKLDYNASTGITLLRVEAYRPIDARDLARAMITNAEALINRLNERAQQDAVSSALREIDFSKERALAAQAKVTEFRRREALIDPSLLSKSMIEAITQLTVEVAQSSAQLSEIGKSAPQSPQMANLRTKITSLQQEIKKQREQLGGSSGALAPKIAEYDRLVLETEFAAKTFVTAMNSLDTARLEARKQKIYLDPVAEPSLPDSSTYPYRLINIILVAFVSFLAYRIGEVLIADTKSHSVR